MSEKEIEQELQDKGLNTPRLCPADIDAVIINKTFTIMPSKKIKICNLPLASGFTVQGESACGSELKFILG